MLYIKRVILAETPDRNNEKNISSTGSKVKQLLITSKFLQTIINYLIKFLLK